MYALHTHLDVLPGIDRKTPTIACLLDIKKVFDSVKQARLQIYKLNKILDFHSHIRKLTLSFLHGRQPQVEVLQQLIYTI